ncbi:MAG: hypothetical protein N4A33_07240 [Bacteriovoracaceae bacterium]|jgi:hypothetical protein|nr:hypothetical protein [Bacteriovoracaceae bacterium]
MKEFLKGTLFFAMINLFYMGATYAQEVDYSQINDAAKKEKVASRNKALNNFMEIINLKGVLSSSFPKKQKLKGFNKEYKPLLKCIFKFSKKMKGGVAGAQILSDIITSIMENDKITEDSFLIEKAVENCRHTYDRLDRGFVSKKIDLEATEKVKKFVLDLYSRRVLKCQVREISAQAAFVAGVRAGTNMAKCLFSNGVVRRYLGITLGAGIGLEASFSASKYSFNKSTPLKSTGIILFSSTKISSLIFGPFYEVEDSYMLPKDGDLDEFSFGAGGMMVAGDLKFGVQVIPGQVRWNFLLKQLQ